MASPAYNGCDCHEDPVKPLIASLRRLIRARRWALERQSGYLYDERRADSLRAIVNGEAGVSRKTGFHWPVPRNLIQIL